LEHAEDLDRRRGGVGGGLEQRLAAKMRKRGERLLDRNRLRDALELRQLAERLVPLGERLELAGVARALAGEARRLEHRREMSRPASERVPGLGLELEHPFQALPQE